MVFSSPMLQTSTVSSTPQPALRVLGPNRHPQTRLMGLAYSYDPFSTTPTDRSICQSQGVFGSKKPRKRGHVAHRGQVPLLLSPKFHATWHILAQREALPGAGDRETGRQASLEAAIHLARKIGTDLLRFDPEAWRAGSQTRRSTERSTGGADRSSGTGGPGGSWEPGGWKGSGLRRIWGSGKPLVDYGVGSSNWLIPT